MFEETFTTLLPFLSPPKNFLAEENTEYDLTWKKSREDGSEVLVDLLPSPPNRPVLLLVQLLYNLVYLTLIARYYILPLNKVLQCVSSNASVVTRE